MTTGVSERILTIAGDEALLSEARAALPALHSEGAAAGGQDMVDIMFPYQEPFNRTPRDKAQWKMFWSVYVEALEGISAPALKAALAAYVKLPTSHFFPAPGPLLALCEKEQAAINRRWRIAQAALALPAGCDDPAAASSAFSATFGDQ